MLVLIREYQSDNVEIFERLDKHISVLVLQTLLDDIQKELEFFLELWTA